jgi:fido (protein-threonine AMPylation protein)
MNGARTEAMLRDWRYGPVQAERLVGALLHLEEFEDVDPQHPLGGPDGLKDVLSRRNAMVWVSAAYFPPTASTFKEVKEKFEHDMEGVKKNSATGFCFFSNQYLTIGQRQELLELSPAAQTEIYHLERIVSLLNAPKGCGIRLEYLRIPMSEEEQLAFWSTVNADVVRRLANNERRSERQINELGGKLDLILARTIAIQENLTAFPSKLIASPPDPDVEFPTSSMTISGLCWLHRLLTSDLSVAEAVRGRFRAVQVWIGPVGSTIDSAKLVPPAPEEIPRLIGQTLDWWANRHRQLRRAGKPEVAASLAELHHRFLAIHPFLDANGRIARCILDQAARELLNQGVSQELTADRPKYFEALTEADKGNLRPLTQCVLASLM